MEVAHNHMLDYVCPQCGPDRRGDDSHTNTNHIWPPEDPVPCPACDRVEVVTRMAIVEVTRMSDSIGGAIVPLTPQAMEGFPWAAECLMCPWNTMMGGWRDAFDFAFSHARGHCIEIMNSRQNFLSAPNMGALIIQEALKELEEEDDNDEPGTSYGRWGTE